MIAPIWFEKEEELIVTISVSGELENVLVEKNPCYIW